MADNTDRYIINGGESPSAPDPVAISSRQECSAWASDPANDIQVSLYIRALAKFYDVNYTETNSYFQIAAIHGFPWSLPWNDAEAPHNKVHQQFVYCTHNMINFPTWHRPYMRLFEQRIQELMLECIGDLNIANDHEKASWTVAAKQWRLPYWDWALPDPAIPAIYRDENIDIRKPRSDLATMRQNETVPNPLFRYQLRVDSKPTVMGELPGKYALKDVSSRPDDPKWSLYDGTSRWPGDLVHGTNDIATMTTQLRGEMNPTDDDSRPGFVLINEMVYRMYLSGYITRWQDFASTFTANKKAPANWQGWLSLEQIHNLLHGAIGGNGHMGDPAVAAFDPVFFMHHCNIDRQFAIWQVLNPETWFSSQDPKGSPTGSTELAPFFRSQTEQFTSDDVRNWTKLGYQYDVTRKLNASETNTARIARVAEYIGETYRGNTSDILTLPENQQYLGREAPAPDDPEPVRVQRKARAMFVSQQVSDSDAVPMIGTNGEGTHDSDLEAPATDPGHAQGHHLTYPDYIINVLYDRYALQGAAYTLHFFIGDVPEGELGALSGAAAHHERHVGSVYTFSAAILNHCDNCAQQAEAGELCTAQIPLTVQVLDHAKDTAIDEINDIHPDSVEQYLRTHLSWKATSFTGQVVRLDQLPRTRVFVLKGIARHYPEPERLSHYDYYTPMPSVTEGKPGGATAAHYENPQEGLHG